MKIPQILYKILSLEFHKVSMEILLEFQLILKKTFYVVFCDSKYILRFYEDSIELFQEISNHNLHEIFHRIVMETA